MGSGVSPLLQAQFSRAGGVDPVARAGVAGRLAPEASVGGPLSKVQTGDRIRLSVADRRLDLLVDEAELAKRTPKADLADPPRGYKRLYADHVLQAPQGCDFDFLRNLSD